MKQRCFQNVRNEVRTALSHMQPSKTEFASDMTVWLILSQQPPGEYFLTVCWAVACSFQMKLVKKKYVGLHQILVITLVKSRLWEVHSLHERHRLVCNDSRTNRRVASVVKNCAKQKYADRSVVGNTREADSCKDKSFLFTFCLNKCC